MANNPIKINGSGANPIAGTVESVAGYPAKLKFFKVECSPYYWARVYVNGAYKVRSLKTESRKEAINLTKKFYEDVLVNAKTGALKASRNRSFTYVGRSYIETQNGIGNNRRYRDDLSRFKVGLVPHFAEKDVGLITNEDIRFLIKKLQLKDLSIATINHYLIVLRKILNYAVDNQLIDRLPNFPKISGRTTGTTKRDYFELEEYRKLTLAVDKLEAQGLKVRGVPITAEMKYLIQFMVNSFIRPSDLRVLKHRHVKVVTKPDIEDKKQSQFLLLSHPATKTTDQEVVTMVECAAIYERLLAFQQARGFGQKDDYVFFPNYLNRDTMVSRAGKLFSEIVKEAGVGNEDEKHTLYSLRHTAIMYRLINGENINTLQLAKNARTSQAMIEKFYASRLTNLHNVDALHSFKPKPKKKQASS